MRKSDRIAEFMAGLDAKPGGGTDPHLAGYFECFNSGRYYEAHDVLEDLWLRQGRNHPEHAFHKGLIQFSGGFVHLRLQYLHPDHPKHGRRLAPARRLLLMAIRNLGPYGPSHRGIDLSIPLEVAARCVRFIEEGDFKRNPWDPEAPPKLPFS
jgi:hypothetical protein